MSLCTGASWPGPLTAIDPDVGEGELRAALDQAVERGEYGSAAVIAGDLINLLRIRGQVKDVLDVINQATELTRSAGLGPWSQLSNAVQRLQVLALTGHAEEVLAEVQELRKRSRELPDEAGPPENVRPWHVQEGILDIGAYAAITSKRWQTALDLNAENLESARRGQPT